MKKETEKYVAAGGGLLASLVTGAVCYYAGESKGYSDAKQAAELASIGIRGEVFTLEEKDKALVKALEVLARERLEVTERIAKEFDVRMNDIRIALVDLIKNPVYKDVKYESFSRDCFTRRQRVILYEKHADRAEFEAAFDQRVLLPLKKLFSEMAAYPSTTLVII